MAVMLRKQDGKMFYLPTSDPAKRTQRRVSRVRDDRRDLSPFSLHPTMVAPEFSVDTKASIEARFGHRCAFRLNHFSTLHFHHVLDEASELGSSYLVRLHIIPLGTFTYHSASRSTLSD